MSAGGLDGLQSKVDDLHHLVAKVCDEVVELRAEALRLRRVADAAVRQRRAGYAEPYSWAEDEAAGLELIAATDELIETRAKAEGAT